MGMFDIQKPEIEGVKNYDELVEIYYNEFNCYQKYTSYHELKSGKTVRQHRLDMVFKFIVEDLKKIGIDIDVKKMKNNFVERFKKENPRWLNDNFDKGYGYVKGKVDLPYIEFGDFKDHGLTSGYVTKEGLFYACEFEHHVYLCENLKKHGIVGSEYDDQRMDTYAIAEELGWVKISNFDINFRGKFLDKKMSKAQKEFLVDFYVYYDKPKAKFNGGTEYTLAEILEKC